jgi:TetR/AcrR family transcriptional repressor of mexJK operon
MSATTGATPDCQSPKRKQMLDAAADLFIAQGYGAVSMDAIARAAGVSKATLYAHFASKDRLFATIITDACQANFGWYAMVPAAEQEPRTALLELGRRTLRFILDEEVLAIHRVVIAESPRFPELGRAFYEGGPRVANRKMCAWIEHQVERGVLYVGDPAAASDHWFGLLKGDIYVRALLGLESAPDEAEIDAVVQRAVEVFLRAYGRPPERQPVSLAEEPAGLAEH